LAFLIVSSARSTVCFLKDRDERRSGGQIRVALGFDAGYSCQPLSAFLESLSVAPAAVLALNFSVDRKSVVSLQTRLDLEVYMLKIHYLHHVAITITDLQRAKAFYTAAFLV
jgi:hypothetical protein